MKIIVYLILISGTVFAAKTVSFEEKAKQKLEAKDYAGAQGDFLEVIKAHPLLSSGYIGFARAAVLLKDRKAALEKLEQGLKLVVKKEERNKLQEERLNLSEVFFTNQSFQYYQNGLNFLLLERASAAVENLEKALALEPKNVAVLLAYARALAKDGNQASAITNLETTLSINADKAEAKLLLAELIMETQSKRALALMEPMALAADANEKTALLYAKILSKLSHEGEALEYLKSRAERNGSWLESLFWLGKTYSQSKSGTWLARKYLMMFLKRERDSSGLPAQREEAKQLLDRVNDSLR